MNVTKALAGMSISRVVVDEVVECRTDSLETDSSASNIDDKRVGVSDPAGGKFSSRKRSSMHRRNHVVIASTPTVVPLSCIRDKHLLRHRRNLALTSNEYECIFALDAAVILSSV